MKFRTHHFIIALLVFLLIMQGGTKDCPVESSVTTVEEKTVTTTHSSENAAIKNTVPEKVAVIETPQQVKVVDPSHIPEEEKARVKTVNRYRDTTYLQGAVIYSDILAEGRILRKKIKAEIEHKETTIHTVKTVVKQPAGLFLSPGIDYSPLGGLEAVETSLTLIKGNFGASAGAYYNFRQIPGELVPGSLGIKLKIHIKL